MSRKTAPVAAPKFDSITYIFADRQSAWDFMKACDAGKLLAGYPSLGSPYTVECSVRTWMDREALDKLMGAHGGATKRGSYTFAAHAS